jgi:hypothetical protein
MIGWATTVKPIYFDSIDNSDYILGSRRTRHGTPGSMSMARYSRGRAPIGGDTSQPWVHIA